MDAALETRLLIGGEQVAGQGDRLEVENPTTEETHVHIETEIAPKDWWYPYAKGEPPSSPPHGA